MFRILIVFAFVLAMIPSNAFSAGKPKQAQAKSSQPADPCPSGIHDYFDLINVNPYDNKGKCYKLYIMQVMQLLSRNTALLANNFRPGIVMVNFGKDSAPGQGSLIEGVVRGAGAYKYTATSGAQMIVHSFTWLSEDDVRRHRSNQNDDSVSDEKQADAAVEGVTVLYKHTGYKKMSIAYREDDGLYLWDNNGKKCFAAFTGRSMLQVNCEKGERILMYREGNEVVVSYHNHTKRYKLDDDLSLMYAAALKHHAAASK